MIRHFVKGLDDSVWAFFLGIDLEEFRQSVLDPEFNKDGMLIAEINGQVVGVVNARARTQSSVFYEISKY